MKIMNHVKSLNVDNEQNGFDVIQTQKNVLFCLNSMVLMQDYDDEELLNNLLTKLIKNKYQVDKYDKRTR